MSHIQKLAAVLVRTQSSVSMDFGLRAIRAIVNIAECYMRQCQNLQYSEIPDIINKSAMGQINWNGTDVIKDVIAELTINDNESFSPYVKQFLGTEQRSIPSIKVINQSPLQDDLNNRVSHQRSENQILEPKKFPPNPS